MLTQLYYFRTLNLLKAKVIVFTQVSKNDHVSVWWFKSWNCKISTECIDMYLNRTNHTLKHNALLNLSNKNFYRS